MIIFVLHFTDSADISWTNTTEFTSLLDRIKAVDTNPRMMTILSNEVCEYKYCFEIYKVDWVIAQWINVRVNQSGYQECTFQSGNQECTI